MSEYPKRKIVRIPCYDYGETGYNFITICTHEKVCRFWRNGKLNPCGQLMLRRIKALPERFPTLELDQAVVMPNHVHLLFYLRRQENQSVMKIINWLKTITTNDYIRGVKAGIFPAYQNRFWQRSFYDHIVRNEKDLQYIREYIVNNPIKWNLDRFYEPAND